MSSHSVDRLAKSVDRLLAVSREFEVVRVSQALVLFAALFVSHDGIKGRAGVLHRLVEVGLLVSEEFALDGAVAGDRVLVVREAAADTCQDESKRSASGDDLRLLGPGSGVETGELVLASLCGVIFCHQDTPPLLLRVDLTAPVRLIWDRDASIITNKASQRPLIAHPNERKRCTRKRP